MPAGRPTKYDPTICVELIDYFDREPYFFVEDVTSNSNSEERKKIINDLPTLAGFARSIGVHRDTINEWTRQYEEFSDAIKKAKIYQEHILVTNGLAGNYNTAFAIFTAKNVLGWKDKQDITSNDESISFQIKNA